MIILRSSLYMMRILYSAIKSSILYQQHLTSLCIYCTIPFHHNYKGKCISVYIPGCDKVSLGHHKALTHPWLVIVQKRTGEIHLCTDYQKLNSIMVRDAFPLPRINAALQAVQSSNWFSSFDLAQGYLQLAMEEGDIKRTVFSTSLTG